MKYMVPEINISKFSLENIVTESAIGEAKKALAAAGVDVAGGHTVVTNLTTLDDWVSAN